MVKVNESFIKYLAGLCDADASLSFKFNTSGIGHTLCMILHLSAAEPIDRGGKFIKSLPEETGFGNVISRQRKNWSPINEWQVQSRRDLNMLLPRLIKHMVIKGRHWNNLFEIYNELKGVTLTKEQVDELKELSKSSRQDAGPIKSKKHPTWAWTAGYLDGDGNLFFKKHPSGYGMRLKISAVSHKGDRIGLELLHKAFGGSIQDTSHDNCAEWRRNLGVRDKSFAVKFLGKLVRHLRLKKHKAEQMLSFYNTKDSQRLIETSSTE